MGNYSEQHDPRISGADFEDANDDDDDDFQVIRLVARLKARIADLEDAAEALVHWCKKRDQWWDETVILNDVLQKKLPDYDPYDSRSPGYIGYDGGPGPGPGE